MNRTRQIIAAVRSVLADVNKTRWSDDILLQFLSEAQIHLAGYARLLKRTVSIPVFAEQDTYDLPDDLIVIERAYYDGNYLELVDYRVLESEGVINTKGKPKYIVFNKHPRLQIKLFPCPDKSSIEQYLSLDSDILGIPTDLTTENIKVYEKYGLITDIISKELELETNSKYGVITDIKEVINILQVYYHSIPKVLTSLDDELEIAPVCDKALRYHVIMTALLADMDTQNRQSAALYAQLYSEAEKAILQDASKDYMSTAEQIETNYFNGVFEWPIR